MYPDLNGDGNSDILYAFNLQWRYRFASGSCFGEETTIPSTTGLQLGDLVALDWDGDGYDDLVTRKPSPNTWHLMRSTGEGLATVVDTGLSAGGVPRVGDVNGDGLDDLMYWVSGTTLAYRPHAGTTPDLLTSATDGFNNSVSFSYAPLPSANYTKHADAIFPEQDFQGSMQVVNSLTASNGIGGTYAVTFHYYGARLHVQGRGFEGFHSRRSVDNRNNLPQVVQFNRQFPYTGTPAQVDLFQTNGSTLISRTVNVWSSHAYSSGNTARVLPFLQQSTVTQREVGGAFDASLLSTAVTTNVVDSTTGTLTDTTTTVTEEPTANGVQVGAQYVQRTLHSSLFTDTGNWCIGRPATTELISSHNLTGGTQRTRDSAITWNGAFCRPSQSQTEPGDALYQVTIALGYDGFGNRNSETVTGIGMSARTSSTNWGSTGQFPVSSTNALSQTTTYGWNYSLGVQTSQTDPNGIAVSWSHDAFGRRMREDRPDGTATTWSYNDCTTFGCLGANNKMIVLATQLNSAAGPITDQFTYTDKFDRTIATSSKTLSGSYSRVEREHDALGRVYRESAPCLTSSCTQHWTTFSYDLLNRVTQVSRPVSASDPTPQITTTFYEGMSTRVVDPLGKQTLLFSTVTGMPSRSLDHNGYYQSFDYDAFGSLLSVVDSLSATLMTATYDYGAGAFQRTMNDADLGASTKTFNALGEVTTYTDAKGQSFSMTYDPLSRPLTRTEPDMVTSWTWGNSAGSFNIGRLASVSSTVSGSTYSEASQFDNKGRLSSRSVTIPSDGTHTYDFAYSPSTGLLHTLTYPLVAPSSYRLTLQYSYDNGLLRSISSAAPSTVFWYANTTNARGQVTQETLGNGVITNRVFDDVTGWMASQQSGLGGGAALQNQSYLFDRVGNVTQRQNNNVGLTENFYYDNVHRLDYSTLGGTTNLDMTYDATGNITSRTDVAGGASWTYHATKKHAVTQAGSGAYTYAYDANGNVTSRGGYTVTWTSYNHPSVINGASGESVQFAYNHNHERWRAILNGSTGIETTFFIGEHLEKVVTAGATDYRHYIMGGGAKIAVYSRTPGGTGTLRYIREDHLGSISSLLADDGTSYVSESFTAFGDRRSSCTWEGKPTSGQLTKINAASRRGYTWHTALGSMGLNDMNGRVQDAVTGRFLSPDPYVQAPLNTQSFNRYSYVFNNPLTYTDPSGFDTTYTRYAEDPSGFEGMAEVTVTGSRSSGSTPSSGLSFTGNRAALGPGRGGGNSAAEGGGGGGGNSEDTGETVDVTGTRPKPLAPAIIVNLRSVSTTSYEQSCAPSFKHSQCVAQCNQEHSWVGNTLGGAIGGALYGGLMGARIGPQGVVPGIIGGALGGAFAGTATSVFGSSSPVGVALAGGAGSMMRNAAMGGNILGGLAGGVTGGAVLSMTGAPVTAAIAGASAGAVAGGTLASAVILGAGAAGAAAGMAGLMTKSYVDNAVNNYCEAKCGK